ncbi:aldo/keto reductase [Paralcaligenes sp. KSB-10]|uniref:aldo/keto reductase n=1 Tax=Paralcaligenes sp. KSB-10 TaxID=2901142 RepID=UPI001E4ABCBE|nr:aldo/keto reductase [Paralcaligenes sp. KSB-10]UHL62969.1 aldo/keto reductase [Paralcaligenes sp. KSB-10]
MSNTQNIVKFHDGNSAPQLGLGVWQINTEITASVVDTAIKEGYRLIDTAAIYGNEAGVGQGIANSGVARDELFITTKLWNEHHDYDSAMSAFDESMKRLGLDYVDLYLIHWPVPETNLYVKAWEAMIQLHDEGRIKSIGVSNFNIEHLQRLLDKTGVLPVVNQIELHPRFQQAELRDFHADHDIVTEAWSPLGRGALWEDPTLTGIALRHGRSVAQVMIRWHIQLGNMVIPKSITPSRIRENFHVYDFMLDDADMAAIAGLDSPDGRSGPNPATFRSIK